MHSTRGADPKAEVHALLRDAIVLTMYNRQTYKVADIDFSLNPLSTFETKKGPISYVDYYNGKYGAEGYKITDMKQPIILVHPSKKDLHRGEGKDKLIHLIPEFCQLTGLSDSMRENFTLMKELSKYLHVGPQERVKEITSFMTRLSSKKDVSASNFCIKSFAIFEVFSKI